MWYCITFASREAANSYLRLALSARGAKVCLIGKLRTTIHAKLRLRFTLGSVR